jgi:hypothetical protein
VISLASSPRPFKAFSSDAPERYAARLSPSEAVAERQSLVRERPDFAVDLRRRIGCHACSIACKIAHDVPLDEFPLRVRWLPRRES